MKRLILGLVIVMMFASIAMTGEYNYSASALLDRCTAATANPKQQYTAWKDGFCLGFMTAVVHTTIIWVCVYQRA